jgi:hypothetical protein
VGPPPSGATRGLGVLLAMLLLQLIYTPDTGACQISQPPSIRRGSGRRRFPAKFALPAEKASRVCELSAGALLRDLHDAVPQGENKSLQLRMYPKLGEDVCHMVAFCSQAYVQPLCYLLAVETLSERP